MSADQILILQFVDFSKKYGGDYKADQKTFLGVVNSIKYAVKPGMNSNQEMIEIVRNWYTDKNLEVPDIVVHDRGTNLWRIVANPNYPAEMWFEIDPSTKHIIRAVGD